MPEWIHNRAEHLLAKNPDMSKSTAFAVATQQAHAMGKSPKGYGTKSGRQEAKQKYDTPKGDEHKANPGNLNSPKLATDQIEGGKGDSTSLSSLPPSELMMGRKVEREHTNSNALAEEIAKDHLTEIPDYYTRLKKMEDKAKGVEKKADDEEGGRAPDEGDKAAIRRFILMNPALKDEAYHEFLERKGINVPKGEAAAYALAREAMKTTEKQAALRGFVSELGCMALEELNKEAMTPELQRMLIGSGVGAGLGAGAGYIGGKAMEPLPVPGSEEKNYGLRGALLGAGIGALGGSGIGHLSRPKMLLEAATPVASTPKSIAEVIHGATEGAGWLPNEVTPRVKMITTELGQKAEEEAARKAMQREGRLTTLKSKIEKGKKRGKLPPLSFRQAAQARQEAAAGGVVLPSHLRQPEGVIARLGRQHREGLAQAANLEGEDIVAAGRGKYGHVKQAGIAVQYDGNCHPVTAETSEEWLAAHFKKTGAFMVPNRLADAVVAFQQSKFASDISREEATKAIERVESLEKQKPTAGQVMRYAGIGAVATPVIGVARNLIGGGRHWSGAAGDALQSMGALRASARSLAGQSLGGAVTSGLIPIARHQLDRRAEIGKLKEYVRQQQEKSVEKQAGVGPEASMTTSEYSGPLSYGGFPMVSYLPGLRAPNLRGKPFENTGQQIQEGSIKVSSLLSPSTVGSPKAQLGSSMKVGRPKTTAPSGPSIQQVAKPEGFGRPIAGAKKTTI